jgi:hypothetical protein
MVAKTRKTQHEQEFKNKPLRFFPLDANVYEERGDNADMEVAYPPTLFKDSLVQMVPRHKESQPK